MIYAVLQGAQGGQPVRDTMVVNRIVLNEDQVGTYEQTTGATLIPAAPLNLAIGDLYNGANWTRNVDGEQVELTEVAEAGTQDILDVLEGNPTVDFADAQFAQAKALRAQMTVASSVVAETGDNATILSCASMFDRWEPGQSYAQYKVLRHGESLYRVQQAVNSIESQPPDAQGMLAVYAPIQIETGEILPWVYGEVIKFGDKREYKGVVYECYGPSGAGANIHTPDLVPAIWRVYVGG